MLLVCSCWSTLGRQCVRGRASYTSSSVTCPEGCSCKSCVIHTHTHKKLLMSARFYLHKPKGCTNRLWPAAIPPWNFFLYQTVLLSTLPFTPPPSLHLWRNAPPLQPLAAYVPSQWCCFLCACLWRSFMGSTWQRMHVAGLCLDTSVSPSSLFPRPRSVRTAVSKATGEVSLRFFIIITFFLCC